MNNIKPKLYFVCANNRENELISDLNRLRFQYREVIGCYKGETERSFVIIGSHYHANTGERYEEPTINQIKSLAFKYGQESFLEVSENDRIATLHYADVYKPSVKLGSFRQVTKEYALSQEAYTYDNEFDVYYCA